MKEINISISERRRKRSEGPVDTCPFNVHVSALLYKLMRDAVGILDMRYIVP